MYKIVHRSLFNNGERLERRQRPVRRGVGEYITGLPCCGRLLICKKKQQKNKGLARYDMRTDGPPNVHVLELVTVLLYVIKGTLRM